MRNGNDRDHWNKGRKVRPDREERDEFENIQLEGRNTVLEALKQDREIDKIMVKKGEADGSLKAIIAKARECGIVVQEVEKSKLDFLSQTGSHQGVVAVCPAHAYAEVSDILERADAKNEPPFILILDGLTDPHNLGAIIRTADAAGVHGVIIPKRRAVGLTAIVSKTAAGALEHVPVARVPNLPRVIDELKEKGIWVACAHMEGKALFKANLTGPIAIVIGGEGGGVGRLVGEKCDFQVSIPMYGEIASLNASVAAGVFMYEVVRRRRFVLE